ncbi:hypothetical protein ACQ4M3_20710 [Leptolyngbya sp. AN03gr2]
MTTTYLITRITNSRMAEFWGKYKQSERCRWIHSLFYAVPISESDLVQRLQKLSKNPTVGFIQVEEHIPLRWHQATQPIPIDDNLIQQFKRTYQDIRRTQSLEGVICVRREEIQAAINLPSEMFDALFDHLKASGLIGTYTSTVNRSEIVSWIE